MKFIYLEGIAYYAKVFEHNRDMEGFEGAYKDCNGAYTIDVVLDDVNFHRLQEAGSKARGKDHEDGTLVKFKRKHEVRGKDGEVINAFSGPPQVTDEEGNDWDSEKLIGNGSRVEIAISVEQSKKSKTIVFTRLEGLKVLEWVEAGSGGNDTERRLPF